MSGGRVHSFLSRKCICSSRRYTVVVFFEWLNELETPVQWKIDSTASIAVTVVRKPLEYTAVSTATQSTEISWCDVWLHTSESEMAKAVALIWLWSPTISMPSVSGGLLVWLHTGLSAVSFLQRVGRWADCLSSRALVTDCDSPPVLYFTLTSWHAFLEKLNGHRVKQSPTVWRHLTGQTCLPYMYSTSVAEHITSAAPLQNVVACIVLQKRLFTFHS